MSRAALSSRVLEAGAQIGSERFDVLLEPEHHRLSGDLWGGSSPDQDEYEKNDGKEKE
jgi:hypothetical protein